jgi:DNA-binding transcriptional MerR regulator
MQSVLSPKDLATAIGVSESSLKRWADEGLIRVSRTAGGHRRILLTEAIRFIREKKHDVVRPDVLGLNEVGELQSQQRTARGTDMQAAFLEALQDGDSARVRGLLMSWYLEGDELAALLDGPVRSSLAQLGELWQHSDEGIFVEHRATDLCIQSLNHLRSLLPPGDAGAPVAMGGGPSGDPLYPAIAHGFDRAQRPGLSHREHRAGLAVSGVDPRCKQV